LPLFACFEDLKKMALKKLVYPVATLQSFQVVKGKESYILL
jgi:hypothetical protein